MLNCYSVTADTDTQDYHKTISSNHLSLNHRPCCMGIIISKWFENIIVINAFDLNFKWIISCNFLRTQWLFLKKSFCFYVEIMNKDEPGLQISIKFCWISCDPILKPSRWQWSRWYWFDNKPTPHRDMRYKKT